MYVLKIHNYIHITLFLSLYYILSVTTICFIFCVRDLILLLLIFATNNTSIRHQAPKKNDTRPVLSPQHLRRSSARRACTECTLLIVCRILPNMFDVCMCVTVGHNGPSHSGRRVREARARLPMLRVLRLRQGGQCYIRTHVKKFGSRLDLFSWNTLCVSSNFSATRINIEYLLLYACLDVRGGVSYEGARTALHLKSRFISYICPFHN